MPRKKSKASRDVPERLTKSVWLRNALEVLSQHGESKVRIDTICDALGVTKGSFYWHFDGRKDFMEALFHYWEDEFNVAVPQTVEQMGGSAYERLLTLFRMVKEGDLGRYDVSFDAWAAHEPDMAILVQGVYQLRYKYLKSLFRELGFKGVSLETRTVAFLAYLKSETQVTGKSLRRRSPARIKEELGIFLKPD